MPYPFWKSSSMPRPTISHPLPFRSYQDQALQIEQDRHTSRWSFSDDDPFEDYFHPKSPPAPPNILPALPPRSPLRPTLKRPNPPPALMKNLRTTSFYYEGDELDYYFNDSPTSASPSITPPSTSYASSTTSSSFPSPLLPSTPTHLIPSPRSAPSHQTSFLFGSTPEPTYYPLPPPLSRQSSRYLTPKHKKYLASKLSHSQSYSDLSLPMSSSTAPRPPPPIPTNPTTQSSFFSRSPPPPPPPPPPQNGIFGLQPPPPLPVAPAYRARCESDSVFEYAYYLHQRESSLPPEESLALCSESGWRCVARRSQRWV